MIFNMPFLDFALLLATGILIISLIIIIMRIYLGPTFSDRVLALDMLVTLGIGFIAVITIATKHYTYVDVAISLGLVGFLATVAFARFIIKKSEVDTKDKDKLFHGPGLRFGKKIRVVTAKARRRAQYIKKNSKKKATIKTESVKVQKQAPKKTALKKTKK